MSYPVEFSYKNKINNKIRESENTKTIEKEIGTTLNQCIAESYTEQNTLIYNCEKGLYQGKTKDNTIPSGNNIAYNEVFVKGTSIEQATDTTFHLAENRVYQVNYNLKAAVDVDGYISVTPRLDGINQESYSAKAVNSIASKEVTVSGSFLVNVTSEIYLDMLIYTSSKNSNIKGAISIVEL